MTITRYAPNTIWLGGPRTEIGDVPASEAITPGHLIERHDAGSGVSKFRKHATAGGDTVPTFATEQSMLNLGVDDAYAADDLVEATIGAGGTLIWALIASGQDIEAGEFLESAGNGTLRVYAAGKKLCQAVESVDNSAGPVTARIRVEVL